MAFLSPHIDTLPERRPLLENDESSLNNNEQDETSSNSNSLLNRMSKRTKQIIGSTLSLFAGVMYALAYAPNLHIQSNYPGASQNNLDYAFSMSTGIFLGSLFYFLVYCVFKKNKPDVYPEVSSSSFILIIVSSIENSNWKFKMMKFITQGHISWSGSRMALGNRQQLLFPCNQLTQPSDHLCKRDFHLHIMSWDVINTFWFTYSRFQTWDPRSLLPWRAYSFEKSKD